MTFINNLKDKTCSFVGCDLLAVDLRGIFYKDGFKRTIVYICKKHNIIFQEIKKVETDIKKANYNIKELEKKLRKECGLK